MMRKMMINLIMKMMRSAENGPLSKKLQNLN